MHTASATQPCADSRVVPVCALWLRRWVRTRMPDPRYAQGSDLEQLCCGSPSDSLMCVKHGDGEWSKLVKVDTPGFTGCVESRWRTPSRPHV